MLRRTDGVIEKHTYFSFYLIYFSIVIFKDVDILLDVRKKCSITRMELLKNKHISRVFYTFEMRCSGNVVIPQVFGGEARWRQTPDMKFQLACTLL